MPGTTAEVGAPDVPNHARAEEGDRTVALSTTARFKLAIWPRYDAVEDVESYFREFGAVLRLRRDVTLCLLHHRSVDIPLERAAMAIEGALERVLGADHGLDLLVVDDLRGPQDWAALGRSVDWVAASPSSSAGTRGEFLERVGVPILRSGAELRRRFDLAPPIANLPSAGMALDRELEILCERPNLFLVRGRPGQGKTSFAGALCEFVPSAKLLDDPHDAERTTATLLLLDQIYLRFVETRCPAKVLAEWREGRVNHIDKHFLQQLTPAEREGFVEQVARSIEAALRTTDRHIVVDGWHLLHIFDSLVARFGERLNIIPVDVERHVVRVGHAFEYDAVARSRIEAMNEDPQTVARRAHALNIDAARELLRYVKRHYLEQLLPRTRYQCFEDLGQPGHNSNSRGKLERLNLPDLTGKTVLDVGCNAGYFSIRMRGLGAASVLGVDNGAEPLRLACLYRDLIYEFDGIDFEATDVFGLDEQRRFDLVLGLSVFHYFRSRQREFLEKMHRLLRPAGVLVLECGLSEQRPGEPFVEKAARAVDGDDPCHFPNEPALLEMAQGFRLTYRGPSTRQPGDAIPRSVLHLRRC